MTKAEEYRQRAEEAEQRAKQARDVEAKRTFEDVARKWREMAAQAERQGW